MSSLSNDFQTKLLAYGTLAERKLISLRIFSTDKENTYLMITKPYKYLFLIVVSGTLLQRSDETSVEAMAYITVAPTLILRPRPTSVWWVSSFEHIGV